jgi:hypothetical protein
MGDGGIGGIMNAKHRICDYCGVTIGFHDYICDKPECKEKLRVDGSMGKCNVCDEGYYQHAGRAPGQHCVIEYACDKCGDSFEKDVS